MTSSARGVDPRDGVRDAILLALVALVLRMGVVLVYGQSVPPADDGTFYQVVAERIAQGEGYTWAWPDGVVTFAAHYPVGYAALLGAAYAVLGASPVVAMFVNAILGAVAVFATHRVAARVSTRVGALCAAAFVAISPTLVGYTLAVMTEGAVAAGLIVATWLAVRSSEKASQGRGGIGALIGVGLALGVTTLVRPQSLLMAPVLGAIAAGPGLDRAWRGRLSRRAGGAAAVTVACLLVCAPWTVRNCLRMDRCVFVSANGGWNLLIGTFPEGRGAFVPVDGSRVPETCRDVFAEAEKDACFGAAGRRRIARDPAGWLRLIPAKLRSTFDFTASASAYLSAAGSSADGGAARWALGAAEVGLRRLLLALALLAAWLWGRSSVAGREGPGRASWEWLRAGLLAAGLLCLFGPFAWISHGAFVLLAASVGEPSRRSVFLAAGGAVAVTLVVHAVFFGAGRYSMVLEPLLACTAGAIWSWRRRAAPSETPVKGALFDTSVRTG